MVESAGVIESILTWSKTRPEWQQDALRRLITQGELSLEDKAEVWNLARACAGLPAVGDCVLPEPVPLREADFPIGAGGEELLKLTALKELKGVNALAEGQTLAFGNNGLTVVYGENGAGKSGYFRVLKHACRARVIEPILGDVRQKGSPSPSAVIEISDASGGTRAIRWDSGDAPSALSQFSLFDSACARQILGAASDPVFLPVGLGAFGPFSAMLDGIADALKKEIAGLEDLRDLDVARAELAGDHEVGRLVASFPGRATKAAIKALAAVSESELEELKFIDGRLKELAAADPSTLIASLRSLKTRVQQEQRRLEVFRDLCSKDSIKGLLGRWQTRQAALKARDLAQSHRSGEDPLPGVGSDPWRVLFLAAEAYSTKEAYKGQKFPVTEDGSLCVLCMQPLKGDTPSRFHRFHSFVYDQSAKLADTADAEWSSALCALTSPQLQATDSVLLQEIWKEAPKLPDQILAAIEELREFRTVVVDSCRCGDDPGDHTLKTDVFSDFERFDEVIGLRIESLTATDNTVEVATLNARRAALTARLNLGKYEALLGNALDRKTAAEHIQALMPSLATRQITEMQKEMATAAIGGRYGAAIEAELKALGVDCFRLDYKSTASKGQVSQQLQLPDAPAGTKPDLVLSEGERRVAALAGFLAEVSLRPLGSAIVLDDPVSSLDHRWSERVAKRLVEWAKDRQVIVFTHHLHFLYALKLAAEESDPEVPFFAQNVRWSMRRPGAVVDGLPWICRGIGERIPELERLLSEARQHFDKDPTGDEFIMRRARFVNLLRATWERVIEEGLFGGVVTRFQSEVYTLKLENVVIGDEDYQAVTRGMTLTSRRTEAHDHGYNAMESDLTLEEMKEALLELNAYREKLKERQKVAKKGRK